MHCVVLNSSDAVRYFRQCSGLAEEDVRECITQVFFIFMREGLNSSLPVRLLVGMLKVGHSLTQTEEANLAYAFNMLYLALKHLVYFFRLQDDPVRDAPLNYAFHDLRGDNIVLVHFPY